VQIEDLFDEAGGRSFVEATERHQAAKREAKEARGASESPAKTPAESEIAGLKY